MNKWSKETIFQLLTTNIANINAKFNECKKSTAAIHQETRDYLQDLLDQIPDALSRPLIPKTPKVPRKKELKRIETIPEDVAINNQSKLSTMLVEEVKAETDEETAQPRVSRRAASHKAFTNIKKQQSLTMKKKMRRPSSSDEDSPIVRSSHLKRTKSVITSSDEEESNRPRKYSRSKVQKLENNLTKTVSDSETAKRGTRNKRPREDPDATLTGTAESGISKESEEPVSKKATIANETMDLPEADITVEPSLYEDATGKSIPMNSTMNPNSTVTFDRKMMNVTVVLESMQMPFKMNETVTIKPSTSAQNSARNTLTNQEPVQPIKAILRSPPKSAFQTKSSLHEQMRAMKETLANKEFDALITDDESSPEQKRPKKTTSKQEMKIRKKKCTVPIVSEDDEVAATPPPKAVLKDVNGLKAMKNTYKPNALFSPYAKDSVKKRVEAFEQVGLNSPKTVDVDAPARVTRTKTRAMAAAENDGPSQLSENHGTKIANQIEDIEERKENNILTSTQKPNRLFVASEKLAQKHQLRTTPISKTRIQMTQSVNRLQHTPANNQIVNQSKAQSAVRGNIVTGIESFIAPPKTLTKANSSDNLAEKKRKMNDEDAKRKRDEALKTLMEEKKKKREEKELKNKLAREAKEKLVLEKRLQQEKEREEKARIASLMQEKQREEAEKKRLAQLRRAQEKEEKRKQEEQLRLLRLQEQEETERQLAEQKRQEQEAERRRLIEARAQQIAAAEAAKMKAQFHLGQAKKNQHDDNGPTSYKMDSDPDPDDDASDNESKPKHVIPYWAQPAVRQTQLAIQQYIPMASVLQFFGAQRSTPDLTAMFKGIKKERLQRTSSAIWKTPPRYSVMMNEDC